MWSILGFKIMIAPFNHLAGWSTIFTCYIAPCLLKVDGFYLSFTFVFWFKHFMYLYCFLESFTQSIDFVFHSVKTIVFSNAKFSLSLSLSTTSGSGILLFRCAQCNDGRHLANQCWCVFPSLNKLQNYFLAIKLQYVQHECNYAPPSLIYATYIIIIYNYNYAYVNKYIYICN